MQRLGRAPFSGIERGGKQRTHEQLSQNTLPVNSYIPQDALQESLSHPHHHRRRRRRRHHHRQK